MSLNCECSDFSFKFMTWKASSTIIMIHINLKSSHVIFKLAVHRLLARCKNTSFFHIVTSKYFPKQIFMPQNSAVTFFIGSMFN